MKKLFKTFLTIVIIFALVIIFTFAVNSSLRSKGIGGMALNELVLNYVNYMIVVEYETPNSASSANEINIRRKGFYKRNGLQYLHTT